MEDNSVKYPATSNTVMVDLVNKTLYDPYLQYLT